MLLKVLLLLEFESVLVKEPELQRVVVMAAAQKVAVVLVVVQPKIHLSSQNLLFVYFPFLLSSISPPP
jgi:hypothetical protein